MLVSAYHEIQMDNNQPDWQISNLYSRSWTIIKKFKLLWILGLASAGGSSYSYSRTSNFNPDNFNQFFNQPNHDLPQKATQVLGTATSSPFMESIRSIFASIPFYFYLTLGIELLLLILIGIVVSTVYSAWAEGMLIQATDTASDDKNPTIADSSQKVIPHLSSLIWLQVVPILSLLAAFLVGSLVIVFGLAIDSLATKIIFGLLGVVALGAFIYWVIMLTLSLIWAPRQVILDGKLGKAALFSSFKLAKKKFWPMLLLGLVNVILTALISFAIVLVAGIGIGILAIIGILLGKAIPALTPALILLGIIVITPLIIGFSLLGGITNSFKATVWTLAYKAIRGKYG